MWSLGFVSNQYTHHLPRTRLVIILAVLILFVVVWTFNDKRHR